VADAANLDYRPGLLGRRAGAAGLVVRELTHFSLASVIARKGQAAIAAQATLQAHGAALPTTPTVTKGGELDFVWSGPGQWLALGAPGTATMEARLGAPLLGEYASVFDQGGSRNLLELRGPRVRDVLAKGMSIDLHPRAFRTGDVAVTTASHLAVHLWQVADDPVYRLLVVRTYFDSLWRWLALSAAEYGCEVETPLPYPSLRA
jgi:methylglutamate dehydrogenase subunit D